MLNTFLLHFLLAIIYKCHDLSVIQLAIVIYPYFVWFAIRLGQNFLKALEVVILSYLLKEKKGKIFYPLEISIDLKLINNKT